MGQCRNVTKQNNLEKTINEIPKLREDLWNNLIVPGSLNEYNPN